MAASNAAGVLHDANSADWFFYGDGHWVEQYFVGLHHGFVLHADENDFAYIHACVVVSSSHRKIFMDADPHSVDGDVRRSGNCGR